MDGGAPSRVQEGVAAAEKLAPLAAQYPIAFALLVVAAMSLVCIAIFYRRDTARSSELSAMIEVNRDQAATLELMSNQLDCMPILLSTLAVMAQLLKLSTKELEEAQAELKENQDKIDNLSQRRRRTSGSVPTFPAPAKKGGG
jgi:uncharacterized protein HemX